MSNPNRPAEGGQNNSEDTWATVMSEGPKHLKPDTKETSAHLKNDSDRLGNPTDDNPVHKPTGRHFRSDSPSKLITGPEDESKTATDALSESNSEDGNPTKGNRLIDDYSNYVAYRKEILANIESNSRHQETDTNNAKKPVSSTEQTDQLRPEGIDNNTGESGNNRNSSSQPDHSVRDKISEIRQEMGKDPSPVEYSPEDEHSFLVTELQKATSREEFGRIYQDKGGYRLIDGDEFTRLHDEVTVREYKKREANLKENIERFQKEIAQTKQEMQEPLLKRLSYRLADGKSLKKSLEYYQTALNNQMEQLKRLQAEMQNPDSEYYVAAHREEAEARWAQKYEQSNRQTQELLATAPAKDLAQRFLPYKAIQALKNRGEYNMSNILTLIENARQDSDAVGYLREAYRFIRESEPNPEKQKEMDDQAYKAYRSRQQ